MVQGLVRLQYLLMAVCWLIMVQPTHWGGICHQGGVGGERGRGKRELVKSGTEEKERENGERSGN